MTRVQFEGGQFLGKEERRENVTANYFSGVRVKFIKKKRKVVVARGQKMVHSLVFIFQL
jgi:hypothetical protein